MRTRPQLALQLPGGKPEYADENNEAIQAVNERLQQEV
jgi:hypothetical protein